MRVDFRAKGAVFGGRNELVVVDFSYPKDTLCFALTKVTQGIYPCTSCTQNLTQTSRLRRAKEITLTGLPFSARETLEWGKLNMVFPAEFFAAVSHDNSKTYR